MPFWTVATLKKNSFLVLHHGTAKEVTNNSILTILWIVDCKSIFQMEGEVPMVLALAWKEKSHKLEGQKVINSLYEGYNWCSLLMMNIQIFYKECRSKLKWHTVECRYERPNNPICIRISRASQIKYCNHQINWYGGPIWSLSFLVIV